MKGCKVQGSFDEVRLLLEHGADPNVHLKEGKSALHLATAICRPDIVTLLAKWGADFHTRTLGGRTLAARLERCDGQPSS